jgi:hypothetical protein
MSEHEELVNGVTGSLGNEAQRRMKVMEPSGRENMISFEELDNVKDDCMC